MGNICLVADGQSSSFIIASYPYSSFREDIHKQKLVKVDWALSLLDPDNNRAIKKFDKFN